MSPTLHPTTRDLQLWRALCKQAWKAEANPVGAGGDLRAAAKRAEKAVAPSVEALKTFGSPLVRLGLTWAAMDDAARVANAATLRWLADGLGPLVGAERRIGAVPAAKARAHRTVGVPGQRLGLHVPPEPHEREAPMRRDIFG